MFSILAMLSQDKVNLFNDNLIEFMDYLINESLLNSSDDQAKVASTAID